MEEKNIKTDPVKKKRYLKYGIIGFAVVVILAVVVIFGQSVLFQGWIKLPKFTPSGQNGRVAFVPPKNWYKQNNKVVSGVVSGVPTVIASSVPSQVGPSVVTSPVPSVVITPVTSGVPVTQALSQVAAGNLNMQMLPELTKQVLKQMAQDDLKKNPNKYMLTKEQKRRMLDLFNQKHKK